MEKGDGKIDIDEREVRRLRNRGNMVRETDREQER